MTLGWVYSGCNLHKLVITLIAGALAELQKHMQKETMLFPCCTALAVEATRGQTHTRHHCEEQST